MTNVLSGPFATLHLALLGAEVIKVENPVDGDLARKLGCVPEYNNVIGVNLRRRADYLETDISWFLFRIVGRNTMVKYNSYVLSQVESGKIIAIRFVDNEIAIGVNTNCKRPKPSRF